LGIATEGWTPEKSTEQRLKRKMTPRKKIPKPSKQWKEWANIVKRCPNTLDQKFPPPLRRKRSKKEGAYRERLPETPLSLTSSPFLPPAVKKRRNMITKGWDENRPVLIDHRESGILSGSLKKACISILTLETRAPSKGWREGWPRGRVNQWERHCERGYGLAEGFDPSCEKHNPSQSLSKVAASHPRDRTVHPTFDKKEPHL
jgi:hypothetical protein